MNGVGLRLYAAMVTGAFLGMLGLCVMLAMGVQPSDWLPASVATVRARSPSFSIPVHMPVVVIGSDGRV